MRERRERERERAFHNTARLHARSLSLLRAGALARAFCCTRILPSGSTSCVWGSQKKDSHKPKKKKEPKICDRSIDAQHFSPCFPPSRQKCSFTNPFCFPTFIELHCIIVVVVVVKRDFFSCWIDFLSVSFFSRCTVHWRRTRTRTRRQLISPPPLKEHQLSRNNKLRSMLQQLSWSKQGGVSWNSCLHPSVDTTMYVCVCVSVLCFCVYEGKKGLGSSGCTADNAVLFFCFSLVTDRYQDVRSLLLLLQK